MPACPVAKGSPPLPTKRFKVGDRVLAKVEDDNWKPGIISQLDYRKADWQPGHVSPYQILLDSMCRFEKDYFHAPVDDDSVVRAVPKMEQDIPHDARAVGCCEAGETCPLHHVSDDKVRCPKYHFCGKDGRLKTRLWKKLAERQLLKGTSCHMCSSCQTGACQNPGEASVDAALAFIDGQRNQNTARKTRKSQCWARRMKTRSEIDAQQKVHEDCHGDCHAIAALGRTAVIATLREGMDFTPLFREDLFETSDMNSYDKEEVAAWADHALRRQRM